MADMFLPRAARGPAAAPLPAAPLPATVLAAVRRALSIWRERQHLARLPAHLRRDIGRTDAEILREAIRPVWDLRCPGRD